MVVKFIEVDWKSREVFSNLRVPSDTPIIIRIDGWRFHKVAEELNLERPFDRRMIEALSQVPYKLMSMGLPLAFSFMFSDEISFLLHPPIPWSGRVEKIVSVIPSFASGIVSVSLNHPVSFDARIVFIRSISEALDYFIWRQLEAWRNALNSYALLALENSGMSREEAVKELSGKKSEQLHEIIFKRLGVNITKIPSWQRRGVVVKKELEERVGRSGKVIRRIPVVDWEIPLFSTPEGRNYLLKYLEIQQEKSEE